jgi:predicted RND superfamily exporter protein/outer membrane lipoprotein-sorting protein
MAPQNNDQVSEKIKFFLKNAKRFATLVILAFVGLGAVSALSLHKLRSEYSMKQFLPLKHPLILADDKNKARFQLPELEPFFALVSLPQGDWLEKPHADRLQKITEEFKSIEGVSFAVSIATVEGASSSTEGLTVGRLLDLTPENKWRERILQDPILTPQLLTPDAKTAVIAIGMHDIPTEKSTLIQGSVRERLTKEFGATQVKLGGIPAVQMEISKILGQELGNFLLLSLLCSLGTLLLFFRSLSSVVIPMVLMVLANVISLAWMAWTGVTFTVLTSTLPVLVSITVVSMATHTMLRFASDWEVAKRATDNPNVIRVLFRSYGSLLLPNFLTAVTTSVGFLAIGIAEVPLIRQYGLTVGLSIFVCWFVVIGALLPLLILFPVPKVRKWTESRARWAVFVTAHPKWILAGCAMIAAFGLWKAGDMNWSPRLFDDLPEGHEARTTTEFVDKNLGGMIPFDIMIEKDQENAWNDPAALAKIDALAKEWRTLAGVGSVVGPQDFLRAAGKVQGRDLASTRQEAAEYTFLYAFSDENPYKRYVTSDGRAARISLRLHDLPATDMAALVAKLTAQTKEALPDWQVTPTAMATTVHVLNNELSEELIYGFWQALLAIGLILLFVFRSVRWTIAAIIPNLFPVVLLMMALGIIGTPVKPGISLIFSIALGISFDNTVYLLGRLQYLRKRSGGRIQVTKAWFQEGNLCLYSSLALSAGFFVFLASYFSLNQQFGVYMLVAIFGGLIGDLIFMPALLVALPWLVNDRKKQQKPKENLMSEKAVAASVALALLFSPLANVSVAAQANPAERAKEILQKVEKNVTSTDETATLKMVIVEADGTKKEREIEIKRKGGEGKHKALVRINTPSDLKGTALLSVNSGKQSDQWLYLPSSKQTRRIQSGKKNSSFMDSELSYEDMGASSDTKVESKVLKEETVNGRKFAVIENLLKGDSSYGKVLVWVDLETYLVGKTEAFDKSMKPLKVSTFSGYKQFDKGVWRAQKVSVSNLQNKRGTILELSDLKLNKGIDDEEFTESALTEGE